MNTLNLNVIDQLEIWVILFKVEAEVMQGDEDSEGWMEHKSPDQSNIEKMTHES